MNLIIENSKYVEYYSYLHPLFEVLPEFVQFNWMISDIEVNYCPDERLNEDPLIIDGQSLRELVISNEIQFIWGVFSAFKKNADIDKSDIPYADGNPVFWKGSPCPQAENAEFEIVCWDSTCTLFIGINNDMAATIRKLYPDVKNLDEENINRLTK